jgi:glyoxylase-like metal-dependent hydrolase (beta-lactamase superfamily II)
VRDKASFITALNTLLAASNRLVLVEDNQHPLLGNQYQFFFSHGHTPGLMHTMIQLPNESPIIFASDLIPGSHWVHLPIAMGYDRSAELVIEEKQQMLDLAIKHNAKLFYTHDPHISMSHINRDNSGKYNIFPLPERSEGRGCPKGG